MKKAKSMCEKDCIHLHACRRMACHEQRQLHKTCVRQCNRNFCKAYESVQDFLGKHKQDARDFVCQRFYPMQVFSAKEMLDDMIENDVLGVHEK